MYRPQDNNQIWQRGLIAGLALLSLLIPITTTVISSTSGSALADAGRPSDYRQTALMLVLALVFGVIALMRNRAMTATPVRWLSIGIASLGVLISLYLLWSLVGLCGTGIVSGVCQP